MRELAAYLFLTSLLVVSIATPIVTRLGNRFGILDNPGPRKIHRDPIPLSGGWAIYLTMSVVIWGNLLAALVISGTEFELHLSERLGYYVSHAPDLIAKITPMYFGATLVFITGLVDDVKGLSVRTRILLQTIAACVLALCGYHPNLGFLPHFIGGLVGVIWIVGITNAFNFIDGLDGLSSGVALVGTLALLSIMGVAIQPDVVFFLAAFSGTLLGFLRYNYHPARIFLGSSGSLLIGYLMAFSTMQITYMKGLADNWLMPLLTPVFILAVPLYDTTSVVLIRLVQRRSIAIGDQSHFHHRLMKLGFSHRQTVAFIVLISLSVALSAVRLINATILQGTLIVTQMLSILSIIVLAERVAAKVRGDFLERRRKREANRLAIEESSTLENDRS